MSGEGQGMAEWEQRLTSRLEIFVEYWMSWNGMEQSGAQDFLRQLLDIYDVKFTPGTIFEQHPIRLPARGAKGGQQSLLLEDRAPQFTTERMDMYLPKVCVWEMKAPSEKELGKHHAQLLGYWARMRTRYMVLCNFRELWIYDTEDEHGQLAPKTVIPLHDLPARADALRFLRGEEPDLAARSERVTAQAARALGRLVRDLIETSDAHDKDRDRIAKLVLECVFAMFAEDTDLIPPGMFANAMGEANRLERMDPVWSLFDDFGRKSPRDRGNPFAPYVNGPLFDQKHPKLPLARTHINVLYQAAHNFDWQDVRPEIFGSIFEQALSPIERHELGAHFTREADIAKVVMPTVIEPWRARIQHIATIKDAVRVVDEMRAFHVLDPACGCGNFLYVVYREMKRLESALAKKWTVVFHHMAKRRADVRPPPPRPYFSLQQIHGIEKNEFATQLARVVLWIGEHLAKRELGLEEQTLPLKNLEDNIRNGDALLVDWPRPEGELAIVGNPPYLGGRKLRTELGDEYVEWLFAKYPGDRAADLVTYWFGRSLDVLRPGERAGFVCTNSIAQNESREASIDKIIEKGGTITDAWKSYPWPGEAVVHIGIVNWVMAPWEGVKTLDGNEVASISPGLTQAVDLTSAQQLPANHDLCFQGVIVRNHEFVLTREQRDELISGDPASGPVIRPFLIGRDVNREIEQKPTRWVIDFGIMSKEDAQNFAGAFRYVQKHVYPVRMRHKDAADFKLWWRLWRPRPALGAAIVSLKHVLVIPCASPHLVVSRQRANSCFDHQLMVVARDDWYTFGVIQSRIHETWAWARGSTLKGDLRYTNTTIFETFPFPLHPKAEYYPSKRPQTTEAKHVMETAEAFDKMRSAACKARKLGLTKIHNMLKAGELPELGAAYETMNDAVAACYGFPKGVWKDERETLRRLLELNHKIAALMPDA
jgi:N-6 DNA Methylase